jgi:signal transduction histidine kinase
MLDDFITANRDAIIENARTRVTLRGSPEPTVDELERGIPAFVGQLRDALCRARSTDVADNRQIAKTARSYGHDLLRQGLTIGQVVHDYGDVCQSITALAIREGASISGEEFRTLNLCLDDAIAEAVTEFARQRERAIEDVGTERLGILAHELRNALNTAMLSFENIKTGRVPVGGSTGQMLSRSLMSLRDLIDRSLADVRLDAGIDRLEPLSVAALVEEIEISVSIQAKARGLQLRVTSVDRSVTVMGDRQILAAALSNLLQNAFKFTRKLSAVSISVRATADRVSIDIEDECGGLPPGKAEGLFRPFEQRGSDRSGVGLGLLICVKAARANGGELRVKDLPGQGCIFTLELPRAPAPSSPS